MTMQNFSQFADKRPRTFAEATRQHFDTMSRLLPPGSIPYTCFTIDGQKAIPFVSIDAGRRYADKHHTPLYFTAHGVNCLIPGHISTPLDHDRICSNRLYSDCLNEQDNRLESKYQIPADLMH